MATTLQLAAAHIMADSRMSERASDAAFTALIRRNSAFLYRIAYSLLRNPQDAEDAVQDTLLKLHRKGSWADIGDERAYLARITWRTALDRIAARSAPADDIDDLPIASTAHSPETELLENNRTELLHKLINALPMRLREPLLLSGFQDLSSRQIAAILQIPEGTVRARLKEARDHLRQRWLAIERTHERRAR